jgi:hypothetical protein
MSNLIQIKRSFETAIPAQGDLLEAELGYAYLASANSLFIGDESTDAIRIAGGKYEWLHQANVSAPGTLTANAVVITNGNSYVTELRTNAFRLGADGGTVVTTSVAIAANLTHLGNGSNSELATAHAIKTYVDLVVANVGNVIGYKQIPFSNSEVLIGDAAFTYNEGNDELVVGLQDTGKIRIGNSSGTTTTIEPGVATFAGTADFGDLITGQVNGAGAITTTLTNPIIVLTGTANSEVQVAVQNKNAGANASTDYVAYTDNIGPADDSGFIDMGINSSNYTDATYEVTAAGEGYLLMSAAAGGGGTGDLVIATDDTGTANRVRIHTGGFTGNDTTAAVTFNTNNQVDFLHQINTNTVVVAATANVGGALNVTGATGLGNTLVVAGIGTFNANVEIPNTANVNVITVVDLAVSGNTDLGSDAADTVTFNALVDSDVIPATDSTHSFGNNTYRWATAYIDDAVITTDVTVGGNTTVTGNINALAVFVSSDLVVGGNLTVSGTLTTIDTETLTVTDPMIKVASGNETTDTVDIGLYGTFGNSSVQQFTGLFRDQTDGIFRLFEGAIPEPTDTVDTSNVNFAYAGLQLGTLFAAAANVAVMTSANVQITGGQITGITDLLVADGGTGVSTFTTNGIIFGNGTGALLVTAAGTEGQVLQAGSGGVPQFGTLDGGSF